MGAPFSVESRIRLGASDSSHYQKLLDQPLDITFVPRMSLFPWNMVIKQQCDGVYGEATRVRYIGLLLVMLVQAKQKLERKHLVGIEKKLTDQQYAHIGPMQGRGTKVLTYWPTTSHCGKYLHTACAFTAFYCTIFGFVFYDFSCSSFSFQFFCSLLPRDALRGIATVSRPPVCPSVRLSVCNVDLLWSYRVVQKSGTPVLILR